MADKDDFLNGLAKEIVFDVDADEDNKDEVRAEINRRKQMIKCGICQESQESLNQLETHVAQLHLAWVPYECRYCLTFYNTELAVRTHQQSRHRSEMVSFCYTPDDLKKRKLVEIIARSITGQSGCLPLTQSTESDEATGRDGHRNGAVEVEMQRRYFGFGAPGRFDPPSRDLIAIMPSAQGYSQEAQTADAAAAVEPAGMAFNAADDPVMQVLGAIRAEYSPELPTAKKTSRKRKSHSSTPQLPSPVNLHAGHAVACKSASKKLRGEKIVDCQACGQPVRIVDCVKHSNLHLPATYYGCPYCDGFRAATRDAVREHISAYHQPGVLSDQVTRGPDGLERAKVLTDCFSAVALARLPLTARTSEDIQKVIEAAKQIVDGVRPSNSSSTTDHFSDPTSPLKKQSAKRRRFTIAGALGARTPIKSNNQHFRKEASLSTSMCTVPDSARQAPPPTPSAKAAGKGCLRCGKDCRAAAIRSHVIEHLIEKNSDYAPYMCSNPECEVVGATVSQFHASHKTRSDCFSKHLPKRDVDKADYDQMKVELFP